MDRSIVLIFGFALLVLHSTQGAELNSEATLSCNGKEFKCFNTTHYQPCSLTERSGQQPQYMINGNVLPCVAGKVCSDESATCCGTLTEIPVKVETPIKKEATAEEMPVQPSQLKSLPVDEPVALATETVPVATQEQNTNEAVKSAELAPVPSATVATSPVVAVESSNATAPVDMLKTEETKSKKKFSLKGLKKTGPMRLVNGFRAATWRPKISLDSQKDVADNLRKRIYERRNKYEKFIEIVLGKATPVQSAKQPTPGQSSGSSGSVGDTYSDSCESTNSCDDDYDECADGSCDDYDDECESDSCEDDYSDEDDDCDDELEPGEAEAVWEEEEVEGGVEIVEECPDDDDDDSSDDCDDCDDYEYEDGIEETAQVSASDDDDCDDDDDCEDDCSSDDSCIDSCEDDDEECKKKRKQQQANKNKKKKKTGNDKKKTGNKKMSSKKSSSKKANSQKKKTTEKKKVHYPAVQKIRKSLARSINNITETVVPSKTRKGPISGIQNAVLNKVDDILSIKENGGLFSKNWDPNEDTNTGCSIIEGWECPRQGRYAHPIDCQKYVQCSRQGPFNRELSNTVYECEDDEAYDPDIRSCTTDWSSCEALEQCLYHRQLIEDPSDDNSYFICIRRRSGFRESYDVYRRDCTEGRVFDPDWGICVDTLDFEKIKKAKKRRQQIKKQKKCQKKKGQKKKGGQKKKTPSKKQ